MDVRKARFDLPHRFQNHIALGDIRADGLHEGIDVDVGLPETNVGKRRYQFFGPGHNISG